MARVGTFLDEELCEAHLVRGRARHWGRARHSVRARRRGRTRSAARRTCSELG